MRASFLVPFRDDGDRWEAWGFIRERLDRLMPWAELCVGTSDAEVFNKCVAFNQAAAEATSDVFILWDADTWLDAEWIVRGLDLLGTYQWVVPWGVKRKINADATRWVLEQGSDWPGLPSPEIIARPETVNRHFSAPPVIVTRGAFERVNGFDERFAGYGDEDAAFGIALKALCGDSRRLNGTAIHLFHPRERIAGSIVWSHQEKAKVNMDLLRRYQRSARSGMAELVQEPGHRS